MSLRKTFSGVFLISILAVLGLALILLPNWLATNYSYAKSLGPFWGWLYIGVVGSGFFLVGCSAIWTTWKLWGASALKKQRRTQRNKNPSQLS
ncbi:MAG: hypothetical protein AAF939_21630, partial [Planctomycetota bacterium]